MIYILTFIIFLVCILLMSLGVMAHRKPIQGSCGGLSSIGIKQSCGCKTPCEEHAKLYQLQEPGSSQTEE
ncbi:(Na+)-NQR maturation NqrM [Celerinatantimonas sp. YJH-8]|uniref:(Na+)-NQR maturation NqrM n=1 Tax=Celerinatantimonas sp. YJH-8 TaxID=3228714 RepID=UPI0038C99FEA